MNLKVTNTNGDEIQEGDTITDFRGEQAKFVHATRPARVGKSGLIVVNYGGFDREVYDRVFKLRVSEAD
jgi:hypothetical protein